MIGSLVRLLGLGDTSRAASAPRFAPRLEVLDGRALPSVTVVGVGAVAAPAPSVVEVAGSADESGQVHTQTIGEEIPSVVGKASPQLFLAAHIGEEIPQ